tara:strand:- start:12721 stop:15555 length:2835 start_codon:yes stop_codon:yes gene_type:complete
MAGRQGGSRVFFDVVGQMQAAKLISDAEEMSTVVQAIILDAFEGIKGSLDGVFATVGAAIDAVREPALALGEASIYFNKFFDYEGVEAYEERIIDLGVAFGFTGAEALDAGARMAQLGGLLGSGESVIAGAEVGMAFGMIGGMETEEAQKNLISLAQQTGFMYEGMGKDAFLAADAETQRQVVLRNSLYVLDQLNTVENNSVATMQQLSNVMDQFASSGSRANMSIAEMAALSATLVESGEKASKAGRGLKQMLVRIASDTGGAATALHEYGVATQDVNGDMIGLTRIMQQLKDNGFDELNSTQQQQIATSVAGANHAERFMKLMTNFERVTELTTQAINREDTAISELNTVMNTATFEANQMTAAQETLSAQIGRQLLPAMTDAEMASYSMKASFSSMLEVDPDKSGLNAGLDKTVSFLVKGAANATIVANGMYEIAGGAFETFMNIQSLLISIRVYRIIMKQNVDLQRMMSEGLIGQGRLQSKISAAEGVIVSKKGKALQSQAFINQLEADALMLSTEKVRFGTVAERMKQTEYAISQRVLTTTQAQLQKDRDRMTVLGMAASMNEGEAIAAVASTEKLLMLKTQEIGKIQGIIALKGEEHMIGTATAGATLLALESEGAQLMEKTIVLQQVVNAQSMLNNKEAEGLGIMTQETVARMKQIQVRRQEFIATIDLLKATGHLTIAEHKEMMAKIAAAGAGKKVVASNTLTVGSLMRLEAAALKSAFSMNRFAGAAGIASMGLMMFADNEDAMQASMILMMLSMLPAIGSMITMKAATDGATGSLISFEAVATGGLALVAIAAALGAAVFLMKNHSEDMQDSTEGIVDGFENIQYAAEDFAFELDKPGGATDLMLDFGNTTEESMDKAESSVKSFMSAREELFFGFSASRMNQTLFDQLVNQGVGELYYRTEVNVNNQFFGLTVNEMVNEISTQIEERVIARAG